MAKLKMYGQINVGKIQPNDTTGNLVEVMSCEGGCIAGPSVITNPKVANILLNDYVKKSN
jgi:iron only hydrogenase large subunit-like protein